MQAAAISSELVYLEDVPTATAAVNIPFALRYGAALPQCSPLVVTHVLDSWVRKCVSLRLAYSRLKRIADLVSEVALPGNSLSRKSVTVSGEWCVERAAGGGEVRLVRNSLVEASGTDSRSMGSDDMNRDHGKSVASTSRFSFSAVSGRPQVAVSCPPGVRVAEWQCEKQLNNNDTETPPVSSDGSDNEVGLRLLVDVDVPMASGEEPAGVVELEIRVADLRDDWFHPAWRERPLRLKDFLRGQGVQLAQRSRTLVLAPAGATAANRHQVLAVMKVGAPKTGTGVDVDTSSRPAAISVVKEASAPCARVQFVVYVD